MDSHILISIYFILLFYYSFYLLTNYFSNYFSNYLYYYYLYYYYLYYLYIYYFILIIHIIQSFSSLYSNPINNLSLYLLYHHLYVHYDHLSHPLFVQGNLTTHIISQYADYLLSYHSNCKYKISDILYCQQLIQALIYLV